MKCSHHRGSVVALLLPLGILQRRTCKAADGAGQRLGAGIIGPRRVAHLRPLLNLNLRTGDPWNDGCHYP